MRLLRLYLRVIASSLCCLLSEWLISHEHIAYSVTVYDAVSGSVFYKSVFLLTAPLFGSPPSFGLPVHTVLHVTTETACAMLRSWSQAFQRQSPGCIPARSLGDF
jgi:hypothetical protein